MKPLLTLFGALLILSCKTTPKTKSQNTIAAYDTTFLKNVRWDSLNKYVDFHILGVEKLQDNPTDSFTMRLLTVYSYFDKKFINDKDTILRLDQNELRYIIQNDTFLENRRAECLLRINSGIGYLHSPHALVIFVTPSDQSSTGISSLSSYLEKEVYVESIRIDTSENNLFSQESEYYLTLGLKPLYRNVDSINAICSRLDKRSDVQHPVQFIDLFTGPSKGEMYFHLQPAEY